MRHEYLQLGEIHSHIIQKNRIAILVPCRRKDRCPGMNHHRNAIGLRPTINNFQLFHAIQVIVGIEQLMRRMDLDQPYTQAHKLVHLCLHIRRVPRMHAATRISRRGFSLQ